MGQLEWNYPWDLSSTVYRKQDVTQMLDTIVAAVGAKGIGHPNHLEAAGVGVVLSPDAPAGFQGALAACPVRASASAVALNRVQQVFDDPIYEEAGMTVDALEVLFWEGRQYDIDFYGGKQHSAMHIGDFVLRPEVKGTGSSTDASPANGVLALMQALQPAVVYTNQSNLDVNRKLWNAYSDEWQPEEEWVRTEARRAGVADNDMAPHLQFIGDEWTNKHDLDSVLAQFIFPYLNGGVIGEVGSGGGRIACQTADQCGTLDCFDISAGMLEKAKAKTDEAGKTNVSFTLLETTQFPERFAEKFDFVYFFDVLVHVDLHDQWKYVQQLPEILKPGGKALLHTANLCSVKGWERFNKQKEFSVGGFCFTSPDIVLNMIHRQEGLRVVSHSGEYNAPEQSNIYIERDFLVIVERC